MIGFSNDITIARESLTPHQRVLVDHCKKILVKLYLASPGLFLIALAEAIVDTQVAIDEPIQ